MASASSRVRAYSWVELRISHIASSARTWGVGVRGWGGHGSVDDRKAHRACAVNIRSRKGRSDKTARLSTNEGTSRSPSRGNKNTFSIYFWRLTHKLAQVAKSSVNNLKSKTKKTYMRENDFTKRFMTAPTMEIILPISMLIKGSPEMDSTALLLCSLSLYQ